MNFICRHKAIALFLVIALLVAFSPLKVGAVERESSKWHDVNGTSTTTGIESSDEAIKVNVEKSGNDGDQVLESLGGFRHFKANIDYRISPGTSIKLNSVDGSDNGGSGSSTGCVTLEKRLTESAVLILKSRQEHYDTSDSMGVEGMLRKDLDSLTSLTISGKRDMTEDICTDTVNAGLDRVIGKKTNLGLSAEKTQSVEQTENSYKLQLMHQLSRYTKLGATLEADYENEQEGEKKYAAQLEKDLGVLGSVKATYGFTTCDDATSSLMAAVYEKKLIDGINLYGSIEQLNSAETSRNAEIGIRKELGAGYLKLLFKHEQINIQSSEAQKSIFLKIIKEF